MEMIRMDKFLKVRVDQDKSANKKIKKIMAELKKNQDKLIIALSFIALNQMEKDGKTIITSQLLWQINDTIRSNMKNVVKSLNKIIEDALIDAYKTSITDTGKLLDVKIDWNIVNPEFIKAAINEPVNGLRFSTRVWDNVDDLAQRIHDDVLDIIRTGKRPDDIAKAIRKEYGRTAYESKRLVHTELARVVNKAQLEVYKNSGVVDYVMWTATLESNTCDRCAALDGKKYKLEDVPYLPLHPSCRCALIPIVDDHIPDERTDNETKDYIPWVDYTTWESNK